MLKGNSISRPKDPKDLFFSRQWDASSDAISLNCWLDVCVEDAIVSTFCSLVDVVDGVVGGPVVKIPKLGS